MFLLVPFYIQLLYIFPYLQYKLKIAIRKVSNCQSNSNKIVQLNMKTGLLILFAVAGAKGAPDTRFTCAECVDEMHKLGR